jgi:GT2 family glycosyltransferase
MGLITLTREERLDLPDGSTAVVVRVHGQHERFAQCLTSVLAHTPHEVPILIADDASPDPANRLWAEHLEREGCLTHAVHWARGEEHVGFVGVCNAAFAMASRADVVLLDSHCVVAAGCSRGCEPRWPVAPRSPRRPR